MSVASEKTFGDREWPAGGLEHLNCCPVCQSDSRKELYDDLTDTTFRCAAGEWRLWRCRSCGCAYLDPRPSQATIHLAYETYYTHAAVTVNSTSEPRSALKHFRTRLANGYRNACIGTADPDALPIGATIGRLLPWLSYNIHRGYWFIPHPDETPTRRLLDVGCGNGTFLSRARDAGWQVFGCDPDSKAVETALHNGHEVRVGDIEAWADRREWFDVITMSHVIEHLHDPKDALYKIYRLLRPGGYLYINTPNIDALGHEIYERNWRGLEPPRHLVIFDWRSLERLLNQCGFTQLDRHRFNVFIEINLQSASMEAGLLPGEPSDTLTLRLPNAMQRAHSFLARGRSEFLTLMCRKPKHAI